MIIIYELPCAPGSTVCFSLSNEFVMFKKGPAGTSQAAPAAAADKVMPVDFVTGVGAQFFETL